MNFRLTVFRAAARRQSFSHAADDLYLSQSAVSKHIRVPEAAGLAFLALVYGNYTFNSARSA